MADKSGGEQQISPQGESEVSDMNTREIDQNGAVETWRRCGLS